MGLNRAGGRAQISRGVRQAPGVQRVDPGVHRGARSRRPGVRRGLQARTAGAERRRGEGLLACRRPEAERRGRYGSVSRPGRVSGFPRKLTAGEGSVLGAEGRGRWASPSPGPEERGTGREAGEETRSAAPSLRPPSVPLPRTGAFLCACFLPHSFASVSEVTVVAPARYASGDLEGISGPSN